jgi:hypothetical protein
MSALRARIPEAECEALAEDATLRNPLQFWSTLSDEAKQIMPTIAQQ